MDGIRPQYIYFCQRILRSVFRRGVSCISSVADASSKVAEQVAIAALTLTIATAALLTSADVQTAVGQDSSPRSGLIEAFNVAKGAGHLIVPVTVGERTYPFVLDTGCNMLVFDEALRAHLGRKTGEVTARVTGGRTKLELFGAPPCRLGKLALPRVPAACADLRSITAPAGEDVYGVVGFNCLVSAIIRIDFDEGTVTFYERVPDGSGHRIPLEWSRNGDFLDGVYLLGEVAGIGKVKFLVDTGSCGSGAGSVAKPLFDRLLESGQAVQLGPERIETIGLIGAVPSREARVGSISVGPFAHRRLLVDDLRPSSLGLAYLSRYVVTFDFPNKALYLRKGKQFVRRERCGWSGLRLVAMDGAIIIGEVSEAGPAEKAGLELFDELIELDGVRASPAALLDICNALAEPGEHRVTFFRFDQTRHETTIDVEEMKPARVASVRRDPAAGAIRASPPSSRSDVR